MTKTQLWIRIALRALQNLKRTDKKVKSDYIQNDNLVLSTE